MVSGYALRSQGRAGKALSPTTPRGISPCPGKLSTLLGSTQPDSISVKIGEDCKRVEL